MCFHFIAVAKKKCALIRTLYCLFCGIYMGDERNNECLINLLGNKDLHSYVYSKYQLELPVNDPCRRATDHLNISYYV